MEKYCSFCELNILATQEESKQTKQLGDITLKYTELRYRCPQCSFLVRAEDESSYKEAVKQYQIEHNLLTYDEIEDIRKNTYNIPLSAFARAFGFNPSVVSQYERGELIQTNQHNLLFCLISGPECFQRYFPMLKGVIEEKVFVQIQKRLDELVQLEKAE